jgi:hypothetical protein
VTKRDDELGPRLEQLITALAAEDARTVVEEARAAARERAKAILEEALAEQILRHAAGDTPAPRSPRSPTPTARTTRDPAPAPAPVPPAEDGSGLYVFGIVGADAQVSAEELGVELLADGDLAAVVRPVPLAEFGEEALRRNLEDMGWLEKTARAHEEVLDALVRATTLVPLRLCTVFRDAHGVRGMLRDEAPSLADALQRLAGTTEWGVKILADRSKLAAAGETNGGGGEGEGARFLAARKRAQELAAEADQLINVAVGEAHARLAEEARDAVVHPAQSRELAGYEGEMVLNGSYLVEDERIDSFHGLVDELASRYEPAGLSFTLTGPWAPYNFVAARSERNPSRH